MMLFLNFFSFFFVKWVILCGSVRMGGLPIVVLNGVKVGRAAEAKGNLA